MDIISLIAYISLGVVAGICITFIAIDIHKGKKIYKRFLERKKNREKNE